MVWAKMTDFVLPLAGIITILYLLYRVTLPRPIPGIPYNDEAVRTPFGDVPVMTKHVKQTQEFWSFLTEQAIKHKSPLMQVFVRPDSTRLRLGPWVVLCDARESYDICIRRTREFDRSPDLANFLRLVAGTHHVMMPTNDQWRARRYLLGDIMTPTFLHPISAVQLYSSVSNLCQLWKEKARLAKGHTFSVLDDVFNSGMEAIWASTFGLEGSITATRGQYELLSSLGSIQLPGGKSEPVILPVAPYPPEFSAIMTIVGSANKTAKSPLPLVSTWLISHTQIFKKSLAIKEQIIADQIGKTISHFNGREVGEIKPTCAMEAILCRESIAAKKQNRKPNFYSRDVIDEIFGVIIAGYDSTSSALCWALKLLSDHPDVQSKMRQALRSAYYNAVAENRAPSPKEIVNTSIPYIDASAEEILRHSFSGAGVLRITTQDVDLLGYMIPKGTTVAMMGNGPSILTPALPVDEEVRSPTSRAARGRVGEWDPQDIHLFKPERWLTAEENGKIVFNPTAGPHLTFGGGQRGCFGRKLAILQMKISVTLIVWNFILQRVPAKLNGYEALDRLTHQPQKCYVRLTPAV